MNKRDKFYLLMFWFCIFSFISAITLKLLGYDFFRIKEYQNLSTNLEVILKFIILSFQYILIVGCVVKYEFKTLVYKMIPFIPLISFLYFIPQQDSFLLTSLLLLVTCIAFETKFSTIVRLLLNSMIIWVIQLIIIWLRLNIYDLMPVFPNAIQFILLNIDQFIFLTLLYYVNRKWGGKYGFFLFRQRN